MSSPQKPVVVIASLQVQSSFQAVPLGAACIVSALKADTGLAGLASFTLADFSLEEPALAGLTAEDAGAAIAAKIVAASGADLPRIVGFSVYVWNRSVLDAAARQLRALVPGVILFAGGPEVTASPVSFRDIIDPVYLPVGITVPTGRYTFDYLLCGEGERAACDLVKAILSGSAVPQYITDLSAAPVADCATLSSPWLDGSLEDCAAVKDDKGALWELARGCPYACAYCYESKGEKKVRTFPLERLEKELDYFVKAGIERVFVLDPTYNASRERALLLLRLIEKKAPEIHFNFEVRAEHLDREMVEAFAKIPCSLQIGLQSTNPEALKLVNRPLDLPVFTKKIALLNDSGIVFGLDLMYGLPGDSLSTFRNSLDFAVGLYPNNLEIFRLAVLPGTTLADKAESLALKYQKRPPYHVESTPKFPVTDIERAAAIARACDIYYTQGRAVPWFLSALHAIKLKPAQFFQDFAQYIADPATQKKFTFLAGGSRELSQGEAELLQVEFTEKKYHEKGKAFLLPALRDTIRLNGAWTRALAEGEESNLSLSYHPEDLFSSDALDLEYFTENAYMENCKVRVFAGSEGPDLEIK